MASECSVNQMQGARRVTIQNKHLSVQSKSDASEAWVTKYTKHLSVKYSVTSYCVCQVLQGKKRGLTVAESINPRLPPSTRGENIWLGYS